MNISLPRLALATSALCIAFAGCALQTKPPGPPPGLAATPCTPGVCVIQVFVDDCHAPGGIRLDKPLVLVTSAVNMRWEIKTPGFVFASNGVEFDPPNTQFEVQNSPQPNEFRLHNKKSRNGDFYYFVNVQGCRKHDPWIRNQE